MSHAEEGFPELQPQSEINWPVFLARLVFELHDIASDLFYHRNLGETAAGAQVVAEPVMVEGNLEHEEGSPLFNIELHHSSKFGRMVRAHIVASSPESNRFAILEAHDHRELPVLHIPGFGTRGLEIEDTLLIIGSARRQLMIRILESASGL